MVKTPNNNLNNNGNSVLYNDGHMDKIKSLIEINDIVQINIRYTNVAGYWNSISYNIDLLDRLFKGDFIIPNLHLSKIQIHRSFIDPFLPHKTLVFLLDDLTLQFNNKPITNMEKDFIKLDFYLLDTNLAEHENEIHKYDHLLKPFDKGSDMRSEIVIALGELGKNNLNPNDHQLNVLCHYHNEYLNGHSIIIKNTPDRESTIDNIQKVKYAILMVCHVYNIRIDLNRGIFVDYNNIYYNNT